MTVVFTVLLSLISSSSFAQIGDATTFIFPNSDQLALFVDMNNTKGTQLGQKPQELVKSVPSILENLYGFSKESIEKKLSKKGPEGEGNADLAYLIAVELVALNKGVSALASINGAFAQRIIESKRPVFEAILSFNDSVKTLRPNIGKNPFTGSTPTVLPSGKMPKGEEKREASTSSNQGEQLKKSSKF